VIASTRPTLRSTLRATIANHPGGAFLAFFYVTSWILFLPALLGTLGFGLIPVEIPAQPSILLLSLLSLTGGAFVITRIADGKEGIRDLRRRYLTWRTGPQWYLLALFGAPLLLLIGGAVVQGPATLSAFGAKLPQFLPMYLFNVVLIALLISIWEETGWMAFLTARWQKRFGPVIASLIVAPLFGLGHFPLLFISGGLTDSGRLAPSEVPEYLFYLLVLFSVPVRLILTWVFNSTGRALPLVALLHASFDTTASAAILSGFYPDVDGRLLYFGLAIVAIGVLVITRGRLGYRESSATTVPAASHAPSPVPLS
jgi:uncharacterized protein